MSAFAARVAFAGDRRTYEAGEEIAGVVHISPPPGRPLPRVELSFLWQTEGKGNPDTGVAHFEVLTEGQPEPPAGGLPFRARLPLLPRSYRGNLIKIHWLARVRCFGGFGGKDAVHDEPITVR